MKRYQCEVYAQRTIHVSAKNKREARVKARKRFKKNPGIYEIDVEEDSGFFY